MTTPSRPAHLISGHATETLSPAERRQLYRAALDDQEIFDQLVGEESWRQVFSSPGVKEELLEALAEPAPVAPQERQHDTAGGFGWLRGLRLPSLAMGAAAAALLAVALVPRWLELGVTGPTGSGEEPGVVTPPATVEAPATELVAKSYGGPTESIVDPRPAPESNPRGLQPKSSGTSLLNVSYTLELNQPEGPRKVPGTWAFRSGDQFRLRLSVDFTAWLYLFNRASGDAAYTVLYPYAGEPNPVTPSERDVSLPAGVWLTMDETPEDEELVLVVSTQPLPVPAIGRETVPAGELDAALEQAEKHFAALNWRRSEVDERVRLAIEERDDALVAVLRLLGEGS